MADSQQVFRTIKDKTDELVLAATDLAVFMLPVGADAGPIVDDATGELLPAPPGAIAFGELQKSAGVDLTPDLKTEGIYGYGSRPVRRVFVTEESFDIDLTVQELRRVAYQMLMSIDDADIKTSQSGYVTRMTKRASGNVQEFQLVMIAKDLAREGELFPFWVFPRLSINKKGKMSLSESAEMGIPLTFSVLEHEGKMFEIGLGGKGWPELAFKGGYTDKRKMVGWKLTVPAGVTGGTFKLKADGMESDALNHNVAHAAVQTELRKFKGAGEASATGTITTGMTLQAPATLSIDVSKLEGVTTGVVLERT